MKPAYDRLPQQLGQLLRLTPDGRDKRVRTATYYSDDYITPFRVDLIDTPIPGNPNDHGVTGMNGDTLNVIVTLMASPDPMARILAYCHARGSQTVAARSSQGAPCPDHGCGA